MPGSQGMRDMQALMARFRNDPPTELAGQKVREVRDYVSLTVRTPGGAAKPFEGPKGDMVILEFEAEGNFIAVRPSGTEPKVKIYLFAFEPPELIANLEDTKAEIAARLDRLQETLKPLAAAK
jgi:phosphoglucomutase/phosphomannomutase